MHMKKKTTVKKAFALLAAVLMMLAYMPVSLAVPEDWQYLTITLTRYGADGYTETYPALPINDVPGSYWVRVPAGVSLDELIFSAFYPGHEQMTFIPDIGRPLSDLNSPELSVTIEQLDAGEQLKGLSEETEFEEMEDSEKTA